MNTCDGYKYHKSVTVASCKCRPPCRQAGRQTNPYGKWFHGSPAKIIIIFELYQVPQTKVRPKRNETKDTGGM